MQQTFPGEVGLLRAKYLLYLLGNPYKHLKIIHIAGTSGKGSTAYFINKLLQGYGFKVGLHLSPHLVDIRERFQINNKLISEKKFCRYLTKLIPVIEKMKNTKYGVPTYFEILVALALFIFASEKVEYAVIETGLGGLYDATNAITNRNKLVLLTRIGHDHTNILGKTLDKIAYQKAMIIHNGNQAFSLWQRSSIRDVFDRVAAAQGGVIRYLRSSQIKNISQTEGKYSFDLLLSMHALKRLRLGLHGFFQIENASLALTALEFLSHRDKFQMDEVSIRHSLFKAFFPGRFEIRDITDKTVIIDGAHNPQKMHTFLHGFKSTFPHGKPHFLIGFKKGKDIQKMLKYIIPVASHITITEFFTDNQDLIHLATRTEDIESYLKKQNFTRYHIVKNPHTAWRSALQHSQRVLIITGSLYLIGVIYKEITSSLDI